MPRPEPITLQVAAVCAQEDCGATIPAGEKAYWYTKSQKAYCFGGHKGSQQASPAGPAPPPVGPVDTVPYDDDFPPAEPQQAWGFEQKDRLMCRESCAKSATAIFAASIQAGIYKTHPDVTAVTAYAQALEKWCLEALD